MWLDGRPTASNTAKHDSFYRSMSVQQAKYQFLLAARKGGLLLYG
jgi:hypothetical protein